MRAALPALALAALLAGCGEDSPAERVVPVLVEDGAGLIGPQEEARIREHHLALAEDFDIDYRVVTAEGVGDIVAFGVQRYAALGAGEGSDTGRGLLLVVDPAGERVRLEVGHALEGVFTDAFVGYVETRQMVPFFAANRIADGILATTELIVQEAEKATREEAFDLPADVTGSGGAGATAAIAALPAPATAPAGEVAAGATPEATLRAYFDAMDRRDARPELAIYSAATRALLADWLVTPAQMDSVVRIYRDCRAEPARIGEGGRFAVIRYPAAARTCAPFFLVREDGAWRLDLTMMQRAIRFGRRNAWRFADGPPAPYLFAFADWTFDRNGFPRVR